MAAERIGFRYAAPVRLGSWTTFGLWAVAGAIVTFAVLDMTSIGLLLLPASVFIVIFIVRGTRTHIVPDVVGAVEGVAANLLWGAFISHGVPHCEPGVPLTAVISGRPGEVATSGCVNIDSNTWFVCGIALVVSGLVVYQLARNAIRRL